MRSIDVEISGKLATLADDTWTLNVNSPDTKVVATINIDPNLMTNPVTISKVKLIVTDPTAVPVPPATTPPVYTVEMEVTDLEEALNTFYRAYHNEVEALKYKNP